MSWIDICKRVCRWIIKGVPENKIFVNVGQISYGEILKNKTAVVTGGGTGIGYAIAVKLASEGANVLLLGRRKEKLEQAVIKNNHLCGKMDYYVCDLIDFQSMQENIQNIYKKLDGRINIFINNAGIWKNKRIDTVEYCDWDDVINTNLKAAYFMVQGIVKGMKRGDNIIMIGSENAEINDTNPYGISKVALHHFIHGLAKEKMGTGIRINAVAPGPTVSEINKADSNGDLYRGQKLRILRAEEIAEIVLFLLSPAAECINGQVIYCDEGDSLR